MLDRVYRLAGLVTTAMLVGVGLSGPMPAAAGEATALKTVTFTDETYRRGFSWSADHEEFRLTIDPATLSGPATMLVEAVDPEGLPDRSTYRRTSKVYRLTVTPPAGTSVTLERPIRFSFAAMHPGFVSSVGKLDGGEWELLGSSLQGNGQRVAAADVVLSMTVALFEQPGVQIGTAKYYGTYTRTTNLSLVAASNHYRKGTVVRVKNLDNGKSVTVRVVDTGGFRLPVVIDLSTPAFAKIESTRRGVARVHVEKATPYNRPSTSVPAEPPVPTGDAAPVSDGAAPPTTAATASIVVDAKTGTRLVGKKYDTAFPIASLTKVMTAAVFMDTKPDLKKVIAYATEDKAQYCSCLNLAPGEEVTLKDLLYASLIGSANNATLTLVRSTGYTRAEFVDRMNAKAASLGLTSTTYVDPTGLDSGNVSSAADLAILGRLIPDQYPTLRSIMAKSSHSFTSKNTVCLPAYRTTDGKCVHKFVTTNKLLGKTEFGIVAAKTGYIDESRHTYLLRAKDANGHEVILVFLKVYTKAESFGHAETLVDWIYDHYQWQSAAA